MLSPIRRFLILAAGAAASVNAQPALAPLKLFEGAWQGTSKGQPGQAKVERTYQPALNGKFLEVKNRSAWVPTEKNPKGEIHEDWGMISFDRARKVFVLRQFHVEGFVNQYVCEQVEDNGRRMVFLSETIENIPAGWKARETYRFLSDDEFTETFELAAPGKDFELYSESRLRRKR